MSGELDKAIAKSALAYGEESMMWLALRHARDTIREMEAVLEFYADVETYVAIGFFPDSPCGEFMDDFDENYDHEYYEGPRPGAKARAILAKCKAQE
jgi:hypothetical protein